MPGGLQSTGCKSRTQQRLNNSNNNDFVFSLKYLCLALLLGIPAFIKLSWDAFPCLLFSRRVCVEVEHGVISSLNVG